MANDSSPSPKGVSPLLRTASLFAASALTLSCAGTGRATPDGPTVHLDLDGTLDQPNLALQVTSVGPETYTDGVLGAERAFEFTGESSVEIDGLQSYGSFTLAAWVFIGDLREQEDTTLMESRSGQHPFRWYFRSANPSVFSERTTHLVFESSAIEGGNGPTDGSFQHHYQRFAEHSEEFTARNNHAFRHRPPDNWMHVALTYDAERNHVTTYLHGRRDSEIELGAAEAVSFQRLAIAPTEVPERQFLGRLREFRLFEQALSAGEIDALGAWEPKLWGNRDIDDWLPPEHVFYVDQETGDDANDGSNGAPVRTVARGLALIEGKSTKLVIRPGTYHEHSLLLEHSGERFEPIIIEAETPGTVIIDGADPFEVEWTPTGEPDEYSAPWTDITGRWTLDLGDDSANNFGRRSELIVQDGRMLRPLDAWAPDGLTEGMFFIDEANGRIIVNTSTAPNGSVFQRADNTSLLQIRGQEYVALRGITFQHGGGTGWDEAVSIHGSSRVLVEDCTFRDSSGRGLWGGGTIWRGRVPHDHIYRRCRFEDLGGGSFDMSHSFVLSEDVQVVHGYWRMINARVQLAKAVLFKQLTVAHITLRRVSVDAPEEATLLWFDNDNWDIKIEECAFFQGGSNVFHSIFFEINPGGNVVRDSSFAYTRGVVSNWSDGVTLERNFIKSEKARWGIIDTTIGMREVGNRLQYRWNVNNFIDGNVITTVADSHLVGRRDREHGFYGNNSYFGTAGRGGQEFIMWWEGSQFADTTWNDWQQYETGSRYLDADPFSGVTPEVGFDRAAITVQESARAVVLPINLSAPVDARVQVHVSVVAGTAVEGEDFRLIVERDLGYLPLQVYRSASLLVHRDALSEGEEGFTLRLEAPMNARLGEHAELAVTIAAD